MSRNYDNFADLITFSRASRGTSVRHVRYGDELVTNGTFDTDSDWTKGDGWSIGSGVASSDGTQTANSQLNSSSSVTLIAGATYVLSYDVTRTAGAILIAVINELDYQSETTSGTFYYTFTAVGGSRDVRVRANSNFVGTVDNISLKQVTLDDPDDPLLIYNHFDDEPRIDFDAVTGDRKGLLIEEARTNLIPYSEEFDNAAWSKFNSTVTVNTSVAPDGSLTAEKLLENSANSTHGLGEQTAFANGAYVLSVFAKAAERNVLQILLSSTISTKFCNFDLIAGTASNADGSIISVGNGWYRCSLSFTANATTDFAAFLIQTSNSAARDAAYTGDGTSGIYIWGAQIEEGSFPTSYIPTSGSTVTRSADVASIATSAFGFNEDEGTVFVEGRTSSSLISALFTINDNSINNRISQRLTGSNVQALIVNEGTTQSSINVSNHIIGSFSKSALTYQENNFNNASQGTLGTADTSGTVASSLTQIELGTSRSPSNMLNGHIKKLQYFPRRLSDTELQEITS